MPTGEVMVPLLDDGLYRGDGVFEVMKLYEGRAFALADHLDRLERSAAGIHLEIDRRSLETEIDALLVEVGAIDALLRVICTRGGRRIATIESLPSHAESITLATITYAPTVILNGVKSLSYAANMQATRLAKEAGGDEALLVTPGGIVLEAPTSTLFWVSAGGNLRTTAVEVGVLASITRDRLVEDLDVELGAFPLQDVLDSSEAFLASTLREVQAVSRVDQTTLPSAPGTRTLEAAERFRAIVERELG